MNIAVVDDEEVIREQISGFIKKQNPDSNISDIVTGEELLAADTEFDIIFLASPCSASAMAKRTG